MDCQLIFFQNQTFCHATSPITNLDSSFKLNLITNSRNLIFTIIFLLSSLLDSCCFGNQKTTMGCRSWVQYLFPDSGDSGSGGGGRGGTCDDNVCLIWGSGPKVAIVDKLFGIIPGWKILPTLPTSEIIEGR